MKKTNARLQQLLPNSIAGGGTARGDPDLAVDHRQIPVDSATTDDQPISHLGIGEPLCHQAQHVDLTLCQSSRIDYCWLRGRNLLEYLCALECGDSLCGRHGPALRPGCGKGLFPELGAGCRDSTFIQGTMSRKQRHTASFTKGFCRSPEPYCPAGEVLPGLLIRTGFAFRPLYRYLRCHHASQSFQARDQELRVV